MTIVAQRLRRARFRFTGTFPSLHVRNYRLYFTGQIVSLAGTWMQQVGQALLVLRLGGGGATLGLVVALQTLPLAVLAPWAGLVSDRVSRRGLLSVTQALLGGSAFTLWLLVVTGLVRIWVVLALALVLGVASSFDMPARHSFVPEMVGSTDVSNAITLNTLVANVGRVVGPLLAGVVIGFFGLAACFLCNAVSFVSTILALALMRPADLHRPERRDQRRATFRGGLSYVRHNRRLLVPLQAVAIVGVFSWQFPVTLPILARNVFDDADLYTTMATVQGIGGTVGALIVATWLRSCSQALLVRTATGFGVALATVGLAPNLGLTMVGVALMGAFGVVYMTLTTVWLQANTVPEMRGRVMGLWTVAAVGMGGLGAPLMGWIGDHLGARAGLGLGGIAALLAAIVVAVSLGQMDCAGARRDSIPTTVARRASDRTC